MRKMLYLLQKLVWGIRKNCYKISESNVCAQKKISHVTYYAVGNAGDTVLSQCVRKLFGISFTNIGWNIIEVSRKVDQFCISRINKSEMLIIGGGGLFLPDTNLNEISGWQWSVSEEQINSITVPVVVFSVGYNYFPGQEPSELFISNLNSLCKKASFIGLRNHGSIEAVKSLLSEDLADKVTYQPCTTTLIRKIYSDALPPKQNGNIVAFNLAFDREERRYGEDKDKICIAISQAAKEIEKKGYVIYLVYHCDLDQNIKPYMDKCSVMYREMNLSRAFPMDVYNFYNSVECVIGMRGHAQMIPFGLNCEIISLGSHDKMRWFLEDIDALDWYIDLSQGSTGLNKKIVDTFTDIHENNYKLTHKRLISAQEELWNVTKDNMKQIFDLVNQSSH